MIKAYRLIGYDVHGAIIDVRDIPAVRHSESKRSAKKHMRRVCARVICQPVR